MPEDSAPQEQPAERRFKVKLYQTVPEHEVVSEEFEFNGSKKEALNQAQDFVDEYKDLEEGTYRLEAEEIKDETPDQPGAAAESDQPE